MPSNEGETPAEAAANWADLGVTPSVVIAALAAHATALAGVVDPDVYTAMSYYNPLLANIGPRERRRRLLHTGHHGAVRGARGSRPAGDNLFYPSWLERPATCPSRSRRPRRARSRSPSRWWGGVADPVAALKDVLQMDPAWGEMPQPILAAAIAGGMERERLSRINQGLDRCADTGRHPSGGGGLFF